jgi:hypothetical protein
MANQLESLTTKRMMRAHDKEVREGAKILDELTKEIEAQDILDGHPPRRKVIPPRLAKTYTRRVKP